MLKLSTKLLIVFSAIQIFLNIGAFSNELSELQIVSTHTNKCINIPQAKTEEGIELIVWNSNDFGLNQQWQIEKKHNYYIIRSVYNNMVISAVNSRVVQQTYKGARCQHWLIDSTDHGIIISSQLTGNLLGISNISSHDLILNPKDTMKLQHWKLEKAGIEYHDADFNKILSISEMHNDIEYFFSKLYEVHINPYAFYSKDSIEKRKQILLKSLTKPMRKIEFSQHITALNSLFDSHTNINYFSNQYYNIYSHGYGKLFPYDIKFVNGNAFISNNDSLKHLQLLSVNGMPIELIKRELELRINYEMQHVMEAKIAENFRFYLFGIINMQAPFEIKVYDTVFLKEKLMNTDGITRYQLTNKSKNEYEFRLYVEDSIAIIEYNTCRIKNLRQFNNEIDSIFNIIKKENIIHLFIDISRNGGGSSDKNNVFYRNLGHKPTKWFEQNKMKISLDSKMHKCFLSNYYSNQTFDERYSEYLKLIESDKLTPYQKDIISYKNGTFRFADSENYNYRYNSTYNNNIYIIQGYKTSSAAVDMAGWFKFGNVGTIIGSETGGTTAVYIESIPFYMKHSNIKFSIADKFSSYPNGKLYEGIKPDVDLGSDFYKEKYSVDDLKYYIDLINEQKSGEF